MLLTYLYKFTYDLGTAVLSTVPSTMSARVGEAVESARAVETPREATGGRWAEPARSHRAAEEGNYGEHLDLTQRTCRPRMDGSGRPID
eukprot:COSAG02_NODE_5286_length_4470_cov_2.533745_3_plen_89_part_00